jgi:ribosomal protein S27E
MSDFNFDCPHCAQDLQGPVELAASEVTCPVCGKAFIVPTPPKLNQTARITIPDDDAELAGNDQVNHWMVDVRVLVLRAPPVYIQTIIEVPRSWALPADGVLPEHALETLTKAVRTRYPQCPVTPTKIRIADAEALKRVSEQAGYRDGNCRVWNLGRVSGNT